jgi:hypothetical protein
MYNKGLESRHNAKRGYSTTQHDEIYSTEPQQPIPKARVAPPPTKNGEDAEHKAPRPLHARRRTLQTDTHTPADSPSPDYPSATVQKHRTRPDPLHRHRNRCLPVGRTRAGPKAIARASLSRFPFPVASSLLRAAVALAA